MAQLTHSHLAMRDIDRMYAHCPLVLPSSARHLRFYPAAQYSSRHRFTKRERLKRERSVFIPLKTIRALRAKYSHTENCEDSQGGQLYRWFLRCKAAVVCTGVAWLFWHSKAQGALATVAAAVPATIKEPSTLWKIWQVLKEQGLLLSLLLALSAFFSMSETAITTLYPWKVEELAKKEDEGGVFKVLRQDVTRFLTTILIGTTVCNIAATALVTDAATALFGEAGVTAATAVMTVVLLLLTEIAPKSVAVHNPTEVARAVIRPVGWLAVVLYPVGRIFAFLSTAMLKSLGLKSSGKPIVSSDELKLILKGARMSGAIKHDERDMIENVLDFKETFVHDVMTPLVNMSLIEAKATGVEFLRSYAEHHFSRVPVYRDRVDNIIGIVYAMDVLDFVEKPEVLKEITAERLARRPVPFVPENMSVWNLLKLFRRKSVHMAVVNNEYGGAVGLVTLEDVVEEIVGEIFDENDSKEEIRRKTGYMVERAEGIFDVAANAPIEDVADVFRVKFPEEHLYETISGYICHVFGYIPRVGETTEVVVEKVPMDDMDTLEDKTQKYELEVLAGNAKMVGVVRFTEIDDKVPKEERQVISPLPGFVRRAWQCANDSEGGDEVPCSTEEAEEQEPEDLQGLVKSGRAESDEEREEEGDVKDENATASTIIARRLRRRRRQALEAAEELAKANYERAQWEKSLLEKAAKRDSNSV